MINKTAWCFCGSFCTLSQAIEAARRLKDDGNEMIAIVSESVATTDTRFNTFEKNLKEIEGISSEGVIDSIKKAEPIGPVVKPHAMVIAPCTGNTLAKLACGITDSTVTMAAKAHLRNGRPLVIALATNDALSANFKNIGTLMERKNIYFVPLRQDDPSAKPSSLIADFGMIKETLDLALIGKQIRPLFIP